MVILDQQADHLGFSPNGRTLFYRTLSHSLPSLAWYETISFISTADGSCQASMTFTNQQEQIELLAALSPTEMIGLGGPSNSSDPSNLLDMDFYHFSKITTTGLSPLMQVECAKDNYPTALALTPAGHLAVGTHDGKIRIGKHAVDSFSSGQNLPLPLEVCQLDGMILALAFTGPCMMTALIPGKIVRITATKPIYPLPSQKLWHFRNDSLERRVCQSPTDFPILAVGRPLLSYDGNTVASVAEDHITVKNRETGKITRRQVRGRIIDAALSPYGDKIAVSRHDDEDGYSIEIIPLG